MKKKVLFFAGLVSLLVLTQTNLRAQDEEKSSSFSVGTDIVSNYIWRGTKFSGPSMQPTVKFATGGLTLGVWGSFDVTGYAEADPYISYSFPFGLSLGVTDYYYPGLKLFDVSTATGSHALELNSGFTAGGLSLSANYIINEAGGAASAGGDTYFQAGYAFSSFNLFVGAGNGWHTSNGNFNVCNIGLGTSKEIVLSDSFSIPVSGQIIVNPEREALYVVIGFSF